MSEPVSTYPIGMLADFELRKLIAAKGKMAEEAAEELDWRTVLRKRDQGIDPLHRYVNGMYGKGRS